MFSKVFLAIKECVFCISYFIVSASVQRLYWMWLILKTSDCIRSLDVVLKHRPPGLSSALRLGISVTINPSLFRGRTKAQALTSVNAILNDLWKPRYGFEILHHILGAATYIECRDKPVVFVACYLDVDVMVKL